MLNKRLTREERVGLWTVATVIVLFLSWLHSGEVQWAVIPGAIALGLLQEGLEYFDKLF